MRYLLAVFLLCIAQSALAAGQRVALVIGNSAYQNLSPLSNPKLDAERLSAILDRHGFEVMSCGGHQPGCYDLTRSALVDALDMFRRKSKGADVAVVFYAGHGMQTKEQGNIIAPIDIEMSCEADDPYRSVVLDDVLKSVSGAREKIVILDACRNDPLKTLQCADNRGAKPLTFDSISVSDEERKFLLMTSTLNGQLARDGLPGAHSPFAEALFHYLEHQTTVHFDQVLNRVAIRVEAQAREQGFIQVPEILIRGGAPEACLAGTKCSGDPEAAKLRLELDALKAENKRGGEYQEIVSVMVREAGYSSIEEIPSEERKRFFKGIIEASRALAVRDDDKGDQALAALKEGNEETAIRLFEEDISQRQSKIVAENRKAAESARHIAALVRPADVARAAEFYAKAAELDPGDLQTWMDLGQTSRHSGKAAEAIVALETGIEEAARQNDPIWEAKFNNALGDTIFWTGNRPLLAAVLNHERVIDIVSNLAESERNNLDANRALVRANYHLCQIKIDFSLRKEAAYFCEEAVKLSRLNFAKYPSNVIVMRDLSNSLNEYGDTLIYNKGEEALAAYEESKQIISKLAVAEPNNNEWQMDLGAIDFRISFVKLELGDVSGAQKAAMDSLQIRQHLTETDPSNTLFQNHLFETRFMIGKLARRNLSHDEALFEFEEAQKILLKLLIDDKHRVAWLHNNSSAIQQIADIYYDKHQYSKSRSKYEEAKEIEQMMIALDPDNPRPRRRLSSIFRNIGKVFSKEGGLDSAISAYESALRIDQELVERFPNNDRYKRTVADDFMYIGDLLKDKNDLDGALNAYRKNTEILLELAESDKLNLDRSGNLSLAHERVGIVQYRLGRYRDALASYQESKDIRQRLVEMDENNPKWKNYLGYSLVNIGSARFSLGDFTAALESYRQGHAVRERLAASDRDNTGWQFDLSRSLEYIGTVQWNLGDLSGALVSYHDSADVLEQLTASDPGKLVWLQELSLLYGKLGDLQLRLGHAEAGLSTRVKNLTTRSRLAELEPNSVDRKHDLAQAYSHVADSHSRLGNLTEELASRRASLEITRGLVEADPGNKDLQIKLSGEFSRLGDLHRQLGDDNAALEIYRDGLNISSDLAMAYPRWAHLMAYQYRMIGMIQQDHASNLSVRKSYFEDLETIEQLISRSHGELNTESEGFLDGLLDSDLYNNALAEALFDRYIWAADNTEEGIEYLDKALKLQLKFEDTFSLWASGRQIEKTRERLRALRSAGVQE